MKPEVVYTKAAPTTGFSAGMESGARESLERLDELVGTLQPA